MIKQTLIKKLVEEIENNNLAIFAGAGLSIGSGFVDWKNLLRDLAKDIGLDVDKEYDLISLAQYHTNENGGNRSEINQLILNEFHHKVTATENHKILAKLSIDTYWTTNYDSLIEESLEKSGKVVDIKHNVDQLPISIKGRDAVVYKMHGDARDPTRAVLIKDDYENYHLIVKLSSLDEITLEDIIEFLRLSNNHRGSKKSFVIVSEKVDLDNVPDEIVVVPTMQEAYDIIEMEDIERDLGF